MYNRFSDIDHGEVEKRIHQYNEDSLVRRNAIVCVNCGSTAIDQNALYELRCYNCNAFIPWNGLRFTISRQNNEVDDIALALKRLRESSYDEWHKQMEDGLFRFLQTLVIDAGREERFTHQRLMKLQSEWERCKKSIDRYFQDRQEFDELDQS